MGLLFSCQQKRSEAHLQRSETEEAPAPEAGAANYVDADAPAAATSAEKRAAAPPEAFQTSVAALSRWDTLKKLLRTAEMRFRTPDVLRATLAIEDVVRRNGGFILENNLTHLEERQFLSPVSRDSSLETTVFRIENNLVFRVPAHLLDTTLRSIGHWAERLDYRRVRAEDASLRWLEEQLAQLRAQQHGAGLQDAVAAHGRKLGDITDAQAHVLAAKAAADAARLEQIRIDDAAQLSMVRLELYQRPVVARTLVANPRQAEDWQPGSGARMADALRKGWYGLVRLAVFLAGVWPAVIAALGLWWFARNKRFFGAWKKTRQ